MRELLSIFPARQCSRCERLTTMALLDDGLVPCFEPACGYHGFCEAPTWRKPTQAERLAEKASIERFVVEAHSGMGRARMMEEVSIHDVPGWLPEQDDDAWWWFPDRAWRVWHGRENKQHRMGWVIWSYLTQSFTWIRERKQAETISEVSSAAS